MNIQPSQDFDDRRGVLAFKSLYKVYSNITQARFLATQDTAWLAASELNFPTALFSVNRMKVAGSTRNESLLFRTAGVEESGGTDACSKEYYVSWINTTNDDFRDTWGVMQWLIGYEITTPTDIDSTQLAMAGGLSCSLEFTGEAVQEVTFDIRDDKPKTIQFADVKFKPFQPAGLKLTKLSGSLLLANLVQGQLAFTLSSEGKPA